MHALTSAPLPDHDNKTDAVLLYSEDIVTVQGNGKIKHLTRRAFKILRVGGKEHGTAVAYIDAETKILSMKGWCIPAQGKDYEVKEKEAVETAIFGVENGELSGINPPTLRRLRLWQEAAISVRGRPDWLFIKLHCHGMEPREESAMLGTSIQNFLQELVKGPGNRTEYRLHFVTVREMVNIILAACDGRGGNPGEYRDYHFQLIDALVRN